MGYNEDKDDSASLSRHSSRSTRRRRSFCDRPLLALPTPKQVTDTLKSVIRECRDALRSSLMQEEERRRWAQGTTCRNEEPRWKEDRRFHLERGERSRHWQSGDHRSSKYGRNRKRVDSSRGRATPSPDNIYGRRPRLERSASRRTGPPYHEVDSIRSDSIDARCSSESDKDECYRPRPTRNKSEKLAGRANERQSSQERDHEQRSHGFGAREDGTVHGRRRKRGYTQDWKQPRA